MIGIAFSGKVHCGFCGTEGHNICSCVQVPVVAEDANYRLSKNLPITSQHKRALYEMRRRKHRKATKSKAKARTKSRCSFCRSDNHRRPNCKTLKGLRGDLYAANRNWQKAFASTINKSGIGVGALVKVPAQVVDWTAGYNEWVTCIVTGFDLDTMNIFNVYDGRDNFRTTARMKLATVDMTRDFYWGFDKVFPFSKLGLIREGHRTSVTTVVSGCEWEPPEDWYTSKNPELEYVLSKVSNDNKVISERVNDLIKQWSSNE